MTKQQINNAAAFAIGVFSLEVAGSAFHAVVLKAPMSIEKMMRGDAVVAVLSGLLVFAWRAVLPRASHARPALSWGLGFVFALFLELLNDAFPQALFRPKDLATGAIVWSYVLLGTLGAAVAISRGQARKHDA